MSTESSEDECFVIVEGEFEDQRAQVIELSSDGVKNEIKDTKDTSSIMGPEISLDISSAPLLSNPLNFNSHIIEGPTSLYHKSYVPSVTVVHESVDSSNTKPSESSNSNSLNSLNSFNLSNVKSSVSKKDSLSTLSIAESTWHDIQKIMSRSKLNLVDYGELKIGPATNFLERPQENPQDNPVIHVHTDRPDSWDYGEIKIGSSMNPLKNQQEDPQEDLQEHPVIHVHTKLSDSCDKSEKPIRVSFNVTSTNADNADLNVQSTECQARETRNQPPIQDIVIDIKDDSCSYISNVKNTNDVLPPSSNSCLDYLNSIKTEQEESNFSKTLSRILCPPRVIKRTIPINSNIPEIKTQEIIYPMNQLNSTNLNRSCSSSISINVPSIIPLELVNDNISQSESNIHEPSTSNGPSGITVSSSAAPSRANGLLTLLTLGTDQIRDQVKDNIKHNIQDKNQDKSSLISAVIEALYRVVPANEKKVTEDDHRVFCSPQNKRLLASGICILNQQWLFNVVADPTLSLNELGLFEYQRELLHFKSPVWVKSFENQAGLLQSATVFVEWLSNQPVTPLQEHNIISHIISSYNGQLICEDQQFQIQVLGSTLKIRFNELCLTKPSLNTSSDDINRLAIPTHMKSHISSHEDEKTDQKDPKQYGVSPLSYFDVSHDVSLSHLKIGKMTPQTKLTLFSGDPRLVCQHEIDELIKKSRGPFFNTLEKLNVKIILQGEITPSQFKQQFTQLYNESTDELKTNDILKRVVYIQREDTIPAPVVKPIIKNHSHIRHSSRCNEIASRPCSGQSLEDKWREMSILMRDLRTEKHK
ncbi:MAG: hypothetical protein Sylvanvirus12_17 [Sylvanvirus sp.]|uniref:Uncharacterized protein n=1 Tax=Sylvanvirus sp. TaxID=2487774 RepID=A0A3G5AI46_9VIRU|nr:MAG: hypothetical protein Sylvanvirus12_17 [Sylvanvirus sp.]